MSDSIITEQIVTTAVTVDNKLIVITDEGQVQIVTAATQGPAGVGVPNGGTTNQVLAKSSNADFATVWVDQTGGSGSGVPYTGATADVDLGSFSLNAQSLYVNDADTTIANILNVASDWSGATSTGDYVYIPIIDIDYGYQGKASFQSILNNSYYGGIVYASQVYGLSNGGITFGNGSGQLAQDATNLFWDDTNKRLSVQANNNSYGAQVTVRNTNNGSGALSQVQLLNFDATKNAGFALTGSAYNPSGLASSALFYSSADRLAFISGTNGVSTPDIYIQSGTAGGITPIMYMVGSNKRVGINTTNPQGQLHTQASSASTIGEIIQAAASQTANLSEWRNSAGTVLSAIDKDGNPRFPNTNFYTLTRTVPTTVGNAVDIGSFALSNGTGNFEIWVTIQGGGYSQSMRYFIPGYSTNITWATVQAASSTGAYLGTQNSDLEINLFGNTISFRLRRTLGTVAATAYITILQQGVSTDVFTPSSSVAAVSAPTAAYAIYADGWRTKYLQSNPSGTLANFQPGSFPISTTPNLLMSTTTNGGSSPSATEAALVLARNGIAGQAFGNVAEFKIGRYENATTNSRTALDIALTHGNGDASGTDIIRLRSDGSVLIGTTTYASRLTVGIAAIGDGFTVTGSGSNSPQFSLSNGATQRAAFGVAFAAGHYSNLAAAGDAILRAVNNTSGALRIGNQQAGATIFSGGATASSESEWGRFSSNGRFGINNNSPQGQFHVSASSASTIGQIIQLAASQTADAFQVQNSASAVLMEVAATGDVEVTTATAGVILKSPSGARWRVQADDTGALTTTSI